MALELRPTLNAALRFYPRLEVLERRNLLAPAITSVSRSSFVINTNETLSLTANFTGSMTRHRASIDWGDGQENTNLALGANTKSYNATHVYSAPGDYQITTTVSAANGTGSDTVVLTASATAVAPASNLIGWWTGDGNNQTTAPDINGVNGGTLQGNTTHSAGLIGRAFSFDGDGDYITIGTSPTLKLTRRGTLSAWIYPTGMGSCYTELWCGTIVNKEGEYTMARFSDGIIAWGFANINPGFVWVDTGYVAPLNQWTLITIVYDEGVIRTYGNGALAHTYDGFGEIGDNDTNQNELRIGGRQYIEQNFKGLIDEVQIFRDALSGEQVLSVYQAGASGQIKGVRVLGRSFPFDGDGSSQSFHQLSNSGTIDPTQLWRRELNIDALDEGTASSTRNVLAPASSNTRVIFRLEAANGWTNAFLDLFPAELG